jgi:O-antigen/teichoic acid export membrane protein
MEIIFDNRAIVIIIATIVFSVSVIFILGGIVIENSTYVTIGLCIVIVSFVVAIVVGSITIVWRRCRERNYQNLDEMV